MSSGIPWVVWPWCAVSIRRASLSSPWSARYTAEQHVSERRLPLRCVYGGGLGGTGVLGEVHTVNKGIGTRSTRWSFAVCPGFEGWQAIASWFSEFES
jgi:hypothetical protein